MSERYKLTFQSQAAKLGRQPALDEEGKPIYTADDIVVLNPISAILGRPYLYTRQHGLQGVIRFLDQQAMEQVFGDTRAHHLWQTGQIRGIWHLFDARGWFLFLEYFQERTGTSLHQNVEASSRTDSDQDTAELISNLAFEFYGPENAGDFSGVGLDVNVLILKHPQVFTFFGTFPEVITLLQGFQAGGNQGHPPEWVRRWWDFEFWIQQRNEHQAFGEFVRGLLEEHSGQVALSVLLEKYLEFQGVTPSGGPEKLSQP